MNNDMTTMKKVGAASSVVSGKVYAAFFWACGSGAGELDADAGRRARDGVVAAMIGSKMWESSGEE